MILTAGRTSRTRPHRPHGLAGEPRVVPTDRSVYTEPNVWMRMESTNSQPFLRRC